MASNFECMQKSWKQKKMTQKITCNLTLEKEEPQIILGVFPSSFFYIDELMHMVLHLGWIRMIFLSCQLIIFYTIESSI